MNPDIPDLKTILKDRTFKLTVVLTVIFLGLGINLLFVGLGIVGWWLIILLPIVLGASIGALPKYVNIGGIILTVLFFMDQLNHYPLLTVSVIGFISIIYALAIFFHLLETYYKIKSEWEKNKKDAV